MEESILDDEEEWHAELSYGDTDADSIIDDEEDAEMVIENPFGEPQAALLDLDCAEAPLENGK